MDILSHSLLGAAVVRDKHLLLPALIFGAGPDLLNGIPTWLAMTSLLRREGKTWHEVLKFLLISEEWQKAPRWTKISYNYIHSLFLGAIIFILLYLIYPPWLVLMKAWFLHLVLDFFTHTSWFSIKPLYPLSDWQMDFFNWFETPIKYLGVFISFMIFAFVYLI